MSCVGYQSRLFPVCVNRLPHRLCLGYTPPWGVAFKMAGLWWETVHVFLCATYQPTVCTGHRVVLHYNLIMSEFLHLVVTFTPPPPALTNTLTSLLWSHRSGKVKAALLCCWESPLKLFPISNLAWAEKRGAGNMTAHTPKSSVHSSASLPHHTGRLGHMFFLLLLPLKPIRPHSSVQMSFVARVLKRPSVCSCFCSVYACVTAVQIKESLTWYMRVDRNIVDSQTVRLRGFAGRLWPSRWNKRSAVAELHELILHLQSTTQLLLMTRLMTGDCVSEVNTYTMARALKWVV